MNLGLLMGISDNLDYSIRHISDILGLEDNKLNYENEKRLSASVETLKTIVTMLHCIINEENRKLDKKENSK